MNWVGQKVHSDFSIRCNWENLSEFFVSFHPKSYHVFTACVQGGISHIFMVVIYDVCQFSPINCFFKDPHLDRGGKPTQKFLDIITNYFATAEPAKSSGEENV